MKKQRNILLLCSLLLVLLLGMNVSAAEPPVPEETEENTERAVVDTITKTMRLPAGQITLIPRYEDAGDILYILDESSIRIRVIGTEQGEGADVYTLTKTLTELPDNDLERIPMTVSHDGNTCELLYVIYTVTAWDEYELPEEYEAVCCYGWLEKYYISYDSEWEATMTYNGYPVWGSLNSTLLENYLYDYDELRNRVMRENGGTESGGTESEMGEDMEASQKGYGDLSIIEEEETPLGGLRNSDFTTIAGTAVGCILIGILGYLYFLTAPIYAAMYTGGYKRIGRVRMKRRKDHYEAVMTDYLVERAETQNFKIRISKYLQARSGTGILDIRYPSGEVISRKLEKEVLFLVPMAE